MTDYIANKISERDGCNYIPFIQETKTKTTIDNKTTNKKEPKI